MAAMELIFSPPAHRQLSKLRVYDQRCIVDAIGKHLLGADPREETRNKFALSPPPKWADYELRVGDFRVLYRVEEGAEAPQLIIAVIGRKVRNRLFVGGEELLL